MTSTGFRWKFHGEVVPNLDLEVWIKFGPEDITRRVFICREEHMPRQGSSKGLSMMEGKDAYPAGRERGRAVVSAFTNAVTRSQRLWLLDWGLERR